MLYSYGWCGSESVRRSLEESRDNAVIGANGYGFDARCSIPQPNILSAYPDVYTMDIILCGLFREL
jgi:hypothetical protein